MNPEYEYRNERTGAHTELPAVADSWIDACDPVSRRRIDSGPGAYSHWEAWAPEIDDAREVAAEAADLEHGDDLTLREGPASANPARCNLCAGRGWDWAPYQPACRPPVQVECSGCGRTGSAVETLSDPGARAAGFAQAMASRDAARAVAIARGPLPAEWTEDDRRPWAVKRDLARIALHGADVG